MLRTVILLTVCMALMSCSTKLAYNYADWWLEWQIDDLVDLDDSQEQQVSSVIEQFFDWHRRHELNQYLATLRNFEQSIVQQDAELFSATFEQLPLIWQRSAQHIAPRVIELLNSLSARQKSQLLENIAIKQNEQHETWLQEAEEQTEQERLEKNLENLQRWLGDISPQQKQSFTATIILSKPTLDDRIQARQAWLRAFEHALMQTPTDNAELYQLLTDIEYKRSEQHRQKTSHNRQLTQSWLSAQINTLSKQQQHHAVEEINGYIEDITDLATE